MSFSSLARIFILTETDLEGEKDGEEEVDDIENNIYTLLVFYNERQFLYLFHNFFRNFDAFDAFPIISSVAGFITS